MLLSTVTLLGTVTLKSPSSGIDVVSSVNEPVVLIIVVPETPPSKLSHSAGTSKYQGAGVFLRILANAPIKTGSG
jgi:hypothetical protein